MAKKNNFNDAKDAAKVAKKTAGAAKKTVNAAKKVKEFWEKGKLNSFTNVQAFKQRFHTFPFYLR